MRFEVKFAGDLVFGFEGLCGLDLKGAGCRTLDDV